MKKCKFCFRPMDKKLKSTITVFKACGGYGYNKTIWRPRLMHAWCFELIMKRGFPKYSLLNPDAEEERKKQELVDQKKKEWLNAHRHEFY